MLGPQGEVSPEMALQAFALAIAPLPGVTPPAGAPNHLYADAAVAWVGQVWNQLSPEQQTAITNALAAMPDPYGGARKPAASAPSLTLAAWPPAMGAATTNDCGFLIADPAANPGAVAILPSPALQPYVDMMKAAYDSIAGPGHLNRRSVAEIAVCLIPGEFLSANALARPFDADYKQLGLPVTCTIYLNSDKIDAITQAGQLGLVTYSETFVCFAATANPQETLAAYGAQVIPPWVSNGVLAWAGATVANELFGGSGDALSEAWSGYLTEPSRGLSQRGSSAIGFFAQLEGTRPGQASGVCLMTRSPPPIRWRPSRPPRDSGSHSLTCGPPATSATTNSELTGTSLGRPSRLTNPR